MKPVLIDLTGLDVKPLDGEYLPIATPSLWKFGIPGVMEIVKSVLADLPADFSLVTPVHIALYPSQNQILCLVSLMQALTLEGVSATLYLYEGYTLKSTFECSSFLSLFAEWKAERYRLTLKES